MKAYQESGFNANNINQRVVHINVSDSTDFKFSEEYNMLHVFGVVLIQQFSIKSGLNSFIKEVDYAVTKELTHNHDMQTYFPLDPNNLNMEQRT